MATLKKVNTILEDAKELEGKKVLYFRGMGADFYSEEQTNFSDVGNFRIRTSFLNNEGVHYFIEMGNSYRTDNKGRNTSEMCLRIDHLFKVEDRHKPELNHGAYEIKRDWKAIRELNYNKQDITEWINKNLNCNFDTIHVLDELFEYDPSSYELMENINLDHETVSKQRDTFHEYYKHYAQFRKYPCLSIIEKGMNFIKVRTSDSDKMLKENNLQREVVLNF